jgi:MATE family multidrug resistance protein
MLWPTLAHNVVQRFLRAQGVVQPITAVMGVCSVLMVPTCYVLVAHFGFIGAPMAQILLNWIVLFALVGMSACRNLHTKCWGGFAGGEVLKGWTPMLKIGAAGVASNMGQWWSWEIAAGMAGSLGELPLAAHAVLQNVGFFLFPLFFGTVRALPGG